MSEVRRYRKKAVEIEAMLFDGTNSEAVGAWCGGTANSGSVVIHTLEGSMRARPGDWVIRGVQGEFYPCQAAIFEATYEPA